MNQIIFIKISNINQNNFISEIEKLSSIYKFTIKKFISHMNGTLIDININNITQLQKNLNISIIYENEFYKYRYLSEFLKYKKIK
jgi:queuine/archaeosine tRNA-ribosyltransferase